MLDVALLQLTAGSDEEANLAKGLDACRRAKASGADIALFPEMWNIGYRFTSDAEGRAELERKALDLDAPFLRQHAELAAELDMAVGVTFLQRWPDAPRNSFALYDRHGELALVYAKVHTCDFADEAALSPGRTFPVCELDTALGPVTVGAMICFDVLFPESARLLMLAGAEVILIPNASQVDDVRIACIQTRAYENMVAVAFANYAEPDQEGHSVAFSPISYRPDGEEDAGGPLDPTVVRAGAAEGIFLARFDLDRIRRFRELETQGNAYRKPGAYAGLSSTDVQAPFTRADSRRR